TLAGSDYADALDGGAGDDHISGGFGDDVITGGPGHDDIGGDRTAACEYGPIFGSCTIGTGNDTIYAQDGEPDAIDCGPGADTAYVDAVDTVVGCETVRTAPGPAPPAGPSPSPRTARAPSPAAAVSVPRQKLSTVVRRRRLTVTCRLPRAGRCTVRATAKVHGRRTLGSAHATFKRAGRRTLQLRLSRATAKALRHRRSLRVTLTVTATYADGGRTTTKRIKL
ncbi:MAG TPA: hypothetical protein VNS09_22630, partial [Solirubrobacter sp.]|nr:hypothetical protein [Solirubrobacter sp.]